MARARLLVVVDDDVHAHVDEQACVAAGVRNAAHRLNRAASRSRAAAAPAREAARRARSRNLARTGSHGRQDGV